MSIITTGSFQLPDNLYDGIWKKIQDGSVIAKLAPSEGFKYGNTDIITFSAPPKAEWVAEGGNKSSVVPTWGKKTVATHKAQVTVRMTNEVLIMDEDRQIDALKTVVNELGVALARALDLGGIHGLNPLDGTQAASITDYIRASAATMAATAGKPRKDLDDAGLALLNNDWVPNGLALAPTYAYQFKIAEYPDGRRMFPELPLNVRNIGSVDGIAAAISDTVSASKEAAAATNVYGVMGNWDAFKWGIVRNIPLETILYGDPDGQGDLKRTNEIAIRAEIYYAWAVMDPTAFEIITAPSQSQPVYEYSSYSDAECTQPLGVGKAKYISDDGTWTLIEVVENTPSGFDGNRYKVNGTNYADGAIYQLYTPGGEATGMYVKLGAPEAAGVEG